ncbi:MAG: PKD domain-containing protein, partial [Gammaproteobacteria bacterium]
MAAAGPELNLSSMLRYRKLAVVGALATLVACGGGGGGDDTAPTNVPPSADAGADQQVRGGDTVTLAGSGSDSDGSIASYSWSQVSGTSVSLQDASTATATFTAPDAAGALQFRLTVTDDDGARGTDTVTITVDVPNTAPTADAGADVTVPGAEQVTLDGSGSSDPDQATDT